MRAEAELLTREQEVFAARVRLDEAEEAQRAAFDRALDQVAPWQERRDALRARFTPLGERLDPWQKIARALLAYYDAVDEAAPGLQQLIRGQNVLEIFTVPIHELNLVWGAPLGRGYSLPWAKRQVLEEVAKHGERAVFHW